jgi:hypothetical protein
VAQASKDPETAPRAPFSFPAFYTLDAFKDGALYEFPLAAEWRTTRYSCLALLDRVAVKVTSDHGRSEYEKFAVQEVSDDDAIRSNEMIERYSNLPTLVARYSAFSECPEVNGGINTHWLLIHKLQFERLRSIAHGAIPDARFVFLSRKRFLLSPVVYPALVQECVSGIALMEMIDHDAIPDSGEPTVSFVKQEFRPHLRDIRAQLEPFMADIDATHINWNLSNFVFNSKKGTLFYVDMKPSNIFGRWRNEQNLRNIRRDFMQI